LLRNSSLVTCSGEGFVHRRLVAEAPDVAGVVRRDVVHDRRAFLTGFAGAHHGGQFLVIHLHELRGVARLLVRLRDDDSNVVADVARLVLREAGMRRLLHRLPVDIRDEPSAGQAVDLGRDKIVAGEDGDDAGSFYRLVLPDRLDPGVGVGRAHEMRIGLPRQGNVVGVVARAGEKPVVLPAFDRSADIGGSHG